MGAYRQYIRESPGKNRADLSLLYSDPSVLKNLANDLVAPFVGRGATKVLAIDSTGFILGSLAAYILNVGLVLVRKEGKTAWQKHEVDVMDYSKTLKKLEIAQGLLSETDHVLIVDDWSETGGQLLGAVRLAEQVGAHVIGIAAINMDDKVLKHETLSKYTLHHVEPYR